MAYGEAQRGGLERVSPLLAAIPSPSTFTCKSSWPELTHSFWFTRFCRDFPCWLPCLHSAG